MQCNFLGFFAYFKNCVFIFEMEEFFMYSLYKSSDRYMYYECFLLSVVFILLTVF